MIEENKTDFSDAFLWETHGIHVGTGNDHVKHGIDDIEIITQEAINRGYPNITFIIHTPRMTRFRYDAERRTDIKFIRGHNAYLDYPNKIANLKKKFGHQINIKYGIELEWLGPDLGLQWNRSKIFQAQKADFVIGSVHFSREGIAYDGSLEEAQRLVKLRGGVEQYWGGYIEELIEMIDSSWDMIQVIGHLDLPKLYVPIPKPLLELDTSKHFLARRMRVLLEMISEYNLALDINLAGKRKKCGIYPDKAILSRAKELNIPVAIGTDAHSLNDLGKDYQVGIDYALDNGYKYYVSFAKCIPEKHSLSFGEKKAEQYKVLNLGIEMLNRRFESSKQRRIPKFSFGGAFNDLMEDHHNSTSLGEYEAIRIRKGTKSIAISHQKPVKPFERARGLFSHHKDKAGVLSILFNTLASEEINVDTAYLNSNDDGTATAFLTLTGNDEQIRNAVEFVKGTSGDNFFEIRFGDNLEVPDLKDGDNYLLEVDGVDLPIAISSQMLVTIHNNVSGVLLILLSAMASQNINVIDLQLGHRGNKGYAALGVDGNPRIVRELLSQLGDQFHETTHLHLKH
ncbi:histidinol-phosphatase HisJ family protein [Ancylomarina sp. 16SWW S1-10-2]|uniref:histidinol-phosphatase HisJ family protein n=1 Tax=Ancylomarina sp. 16SWW S1-10-2 TaxID=2499681 RepID=UPI0012ADB084|nr:histidinol-phosphatase HisJ family protein [Ancylomarina sp. 16SWW S1-10-2]MRT94362.1 histidinol-phosphatase HisJ family protein [Ancylomarina sp. 16SWW S1-10-2]